MNDSTATGDDGRWMTYAELAELRGISRKAAARLTLRHGWRRQPGNDGATRVHVPDAAMTRRQTPRPDRPSTLLSDDEDALVEAARRADAAIALAERLTAQLTEAGARADRAEARADQERLRADELRDRLEAFRQAEAERQARGMLARLRAALRRE